MNSRALYNFFLSWFALMLVSAMFIACQADHLDSQGSTTVSITLQPSQLLPSGTRAVPDPGVATLNENAIKNVDLFLYSETDKEGEPVYRTTIDNTAFDEGQQKATLTLNLPLETYYKLFPSADATTCTAYAIVNRGAEDETDNQLPDSKTIGNLKANTLLYEPSFDDTKTNGTDHNYKTIKPQEKFVMQGQTTLSRTDDRNLSGDIPVTRVASKVSLEVAKIKDEVTDENGMTWIPDKENIYVSFHNVMQRTYLGVNPAAGLNLHTPEKGDLVDTEFVKMTYTQANGTQPENIKLHTPFYSYPADWQNNESSRPYLVLVVNWKQKENSNEDQTTYYEIPVNDADAYTLSNHHYYIKQEVDVLGSPSIEEPTKLDNASYIILKWGNSMETDGEGQTVTDATMSRLKYLVVDETNVVMNNITSEQIFFFSSDPIVVENITMKHMNVNKDNAGYKDISGTFSPSVDGKTFSFKPDGTNTNLKNNNQVTVSVHQADPNNANGQSYITLSHTLDNTMSMNADYTDYYFEIKVAHKDDDTYNETIKITQYPMIPVKAEQNSDYNDKSSNFDDTSDKNGYVFLNNGKIDNLGTISGLSGNNSNPNRYIISVTALDRSSSYIIGDPRQTSINNLSWYSEAAQTMKYNSDNDSRRMSYYHPTDETSRTSNMISPQFMIASSYGKTTDLNKENAKKRCAAYQEDGYPAGRWRIPTQAEIEYIVQLSAWGIIPVLFGTAGSYNGTTYWSANGAITVVPGNGTATAVSNPSSKSSYYVRCVYDTWYWTDKCDKTKFTWGDKAGDLYN